MTDEMLLRIPAEEGFSAAALVNTSEIEFNPIFLQFCAENLCGNYGANYTCPPDCGTPEEMRARILAYPRALVMQTKWDITDYTDRAAISHAKKSHNEGMFRVIERMGVPGTMAGASNCKLCDRCLRTDGLPCRFPEKRYSCMSAYCINVRALAERCGMEYACSDGRLAFFGLYAF